MGPYKNVNNFEKPLVSKWSMYKERYVQKQGTNYPAASLEPEVQL